MLKNQKCPACRMMYINRKPRILLCFHTAWHECLTTIVRKMSYGSMLVVKCPVCSQVTNLSEAGIHDPSEDLVISTLLDRESDKNIQCAFCTNRDCASSRCDTCNAYICAARERRQSSTFHVV